MLSTIIAEQTTARSGATEMLIMMFLFIGMWFLLISPQKKKQKIHEKMISELKVGDKILTSSGIYGTISGVKGDRFEVKIDSNTTIEIHRSFIQGKL